MDDFTAHIAIPSLITGIIFTLLGSALMTSPPSKINPLVGYRTKRSMRSQETWDFAQRYAAERMAAGGIVMIALSLLSYFIPVDADYKQMGGIVLLVLCCIYMIVGTELALKKKFPKSN
jgi:uncharacterized membrane protein